MNKFTLKPTDIREISQGDYTNFIAQVQAADYDAIAIDVGGGAGGR